MNDCGQNRKTVTLRDRYTSEYVISGNELALTMCDKIRKLFYITTKRLFDTEPSWLSVSYNCFDYSFTIDLNIENLTSNQIQMYREEFGLNCFCIDGITFKSTMRMD